MMVIRVIVVFYVTILGSRNLITMTERASEFFMISQVELELILAGESKLGELAFVIRTLVLSVAGMHGCRVAV
jgi:hypothetical protein